MEKSFNKQKSKTEADNAAARLYHLNLLLDRRKSALNTNHRKFCFAHDRPLRIWLRIGINCLGVDCAP